MGLCHYQQLDGIDKPAPCHLVWNQSFIPFAKEVLESHEVSLFEIETEDMLLQTQEECFFESKPSTNFLRLTFERPE